MRIAISDAPYLAPLVANIDAIAEQRGWEVQRVPEERATTLLLNNRVEIALFSPLGYAAAVGKVDYRIIGGPCLALEGYTNVAGIDFNGQLDEIESVGSSRPTSFHATIGSLILREKFDAASTPVVATTPEVLADAVVKTPDESERPLTLDLSEEWADIADSPLPVAIWACRAEADMEDLAGVIESFADNSITELPVNEAETDETDAFPRDGKMMFRWNDEIETGLVAAMNLLFFHQVIPEIPEVKLLGREEL